MPGTLPVDSAMAEAIAEVPPRRLHRWVVDVYPRTPFLIYAIFLAFVLARYVQVGARMDILAATRFEFLLGGFCTFLAVLQLTAHRPEVGRAGRLLVSISLLFFAMILQLPLAFDPVIARTIFNDRVVKFALLTFMIVVFVESPHYLRLFLAAFLFAIFYIALESFQGLIGGGLYWENQGIMRLHGAVPIYGHPNSLGGVTLGSLPFIWYAWGLLKNFVIRLALLVFAAASIVCVIYSGSRTAYVGLLGLVFWIFLKSDRKWRFFVRGLILGVIVIMIIPQQYIERFESIGGKEKQGASKETRIEILRDAWQIFLENPLGVGVASFPAKRLQRFGREQDTHNLYLEVATNLGIQGFVVFCILVWSMMEAFQRVEKAAARLRKRVRAAVRGLPRRSFLRSTAAKIDVDLRYLDRCAKAGGGFIFVRLVLGLFGMDLYEIYWWFAAGLAIVLSGMIVAATRGVGRLERAAAVLGAGAKTP